MTFLLGMVAWRICKLLRFLIGALGEAIMILDRAMLKKSRHPFFAFSGNWSARIFFFVLLCQEIFHALKSACGMSLLTVNQATLKLVSCWWNTSGLVVALLIGMRDHFPKELSRNNFYVPWTPDAALHTNW